MEGKLKKIGNEYKLYAQDDRCIATTQESPYKKLSLKNCESVNNGYDLDELSTSRLSTRFNENGGYHKFVFVEAYKEGFLKAMELLGNKKFSEEDIILFGEYCRSDFDGLLKTKALYNEYQSLQQTEWDVKIEIEPYHDGNFIDDGKTHIIEAKLRPRLDVDGCLILKRI